jgi:hypothetical protein
MNKWLRKSFFVMISFLTFGLVTPSQFVNVNAEKPLDHEAFETVAPETSYNQPSAYNNHSDFDKDKHLEGLINEAELQSYQKFGTKIKPVIENEFREVILPNIETAINLTATQFPEEDLRNLYITEQPGGGRSEKIFHIKNSLSGKDVLRFHVRRDNPPQDGYWFNFHYHTYLDEFQTHHELGSIYWAKNTPPKWMT